MNPNLCSGDNCKKQMGKPFILNLFDILLFITYFDTFLCLYEFCSDLIL